jgi:hypothetical protein
LQKNDTKKGYITSEDTERKTKQNNKKWKQDKNIQQNNRINAYKIMIDSTTLKLFL